MRLEFMISSLGHPKKLNQKTTQTSLMKQEYVLLIPKTIMYEKGDVDGRITRTECKGKRKERSELDRAGRQNYGCF